MFRSFVSYSVFMTLMASGLGLWIQTGIAEPVPADPVPAKSVQKARALALAPLADEAAKAEAASAAPIQVRLAKTFDFEGFEANTPLKDALEKLAEKIDTPILIDEVAFAADGIKEVGEQPVKLPKMKGARPDTILRRVLSQCNGTYLIRNDHIEVTTPERVAYEVWGLVEENSPRVLGGFGPDAEKEPRRACRSRPGMPTITIKFDKRLLEDALRDIAETGDGKATVILDALRAGDKAKLVVSANFKNVPLDTAVRLLANQAQLKVVHLDNVLYVTTEENAKELQTEQEKINAPGIRPMILPGSSPPVG